jgi:hypothetical protein
MKFECQFGNAAGERRSIAVEITPDESAAAARHAYPDVAAQAFALKRAYGVVGADAIAAGMRHIAGGVRPLQ